MMGVRHFCLLVAEMFTNIHREGTGTTTESDTLWPVFPSIAMSAKELTAVLGYVCRVQKLVAKAAFEASLMPFGVGGDTLLRGVH